MRRERNDETVVSFRVFFSFFSFPSLSLSLSTLYPRDERFIWSEGGGGGI